MHRGFTLILWLLLTLAGLLVVLGVFATRGSVDLTDLPRIQVDRATRIRADEKIEAFAAVSERARSSGQAAPVQVTLTHDELTALIADWGRQNHWFGSVLGLQIAFRPSRMSLTGVIHSLGLEFPFRLDFDLVIEDHERSVELRRLQIGELFAPGFVRGAALGLAMRTVDAGLPRIPMDITSLVVGDGEIIVSGDAVP